MQDQDLLLEFYLSALSKRLLANRMFHMDAEVETVGKMRAMFGLNFTGRISSLITNYNLVTSAAVTDTVVLPDCAEPVEVLRVLPLQSSCWPAFQLFDTVVLPAPMRLCQERFARRYEAENTTHQVSHCLPYSSFFIIFCANPSGFVLPAGTDYFLRS